VAEAAPASAMYLHAACDMASGFSEDFVIKVSVCPFRFCY